MSSILIGYVFINSYQICKRGKEFIDMRVSTGNATFGQEERDAVNKVLESNWIVPGKKVREFEKGMAKVFGKKYGLMVNSGSSANFLVLYLLSKPGVEVITPALTFGTVVAPIIQNRMIPKFFDVKLETYQIDVDAVEKYIDGKPDVERIFMIPALIGNLPDLEKLRYLSDKYCIPFVLDSCDVIGALWNRKPIGIYADMVTSSFYGSHIITTAGAGGIIMTDHEKKKEKLQTLRSWGRASAITSESEEIEDRFKHVIDGIPYDSKLLFTEFGFNMQATEIQGAFGVEQLKKLHKFTILRKENFLKLCNYFKNKPQFIIPKQYPQTDTSWINFPITLTPNCPFSREELVTFLEKHSIQTRPVFSGNITRHPAFRGTEPIPFENSDYIMRNSFLIGCHQALTQKHLDYLFEIFETFLRKNK